MKKGQGGVPLALSLERRSISIARGGQGGHSFLWGQGHVECAQGKPSCLLRLGKRYVSWVLGDEAGNGLQRVLEALVMRREGCCTRDNLVCYLFISEIVIYRGDVSLDIPCL